MPSIRSRKKVPALAKARESILPNVPSLLDVADIKAIEVRGTIGDPRDSLEVRWERWEWEGYKKEEPGTLVIRGNDGFWSDGESPDRETVRFSVDDVRQLRALAALLVRLAEKVDAGGVRPLARSHERRKMSER